MFIHTFYTWSLANFLHPVMMLLSGYIVNGYNREISPRHPEDFFVSFIFSTLFSLPCLLIGWYLLGMIVLSNHTRLARLLMWLVCASGLVIAEVIFILWLVDEPLNLRDMLLALPAMLSVNIAVIVRYKQFLGLLDSLRQNDPENTTI